MASRTIKIVIQTRGEQKATQSFKKVALGARNVGSAVSLARMELKRLKRAQDQAAQSASSFAFVQKRLTASYLVGNIAARTISAAVSKLGQAFGYGVGSAIDFEFSMTKISSISGVAGANLRSLENRIKEIASQSPKTSTEVAQAALEMSKMGLAGKDLENSLEGVVGLSVALDESVDAVGQTLVNVKNVFQKDASEITNLSNQLFTTLGNSALNLEKFGTAFSFAGSSARLAGVSFEELTGLMGVLADNGVKASTIGTQLRQVFTRLDDPTSEVSQLLGEQSIKTKGLSQTLRILNQIIRDSGDAKKLFGQRAIGVINILTKNIDKIETLTEKTKNMEKSTIDASNALGGTLQGELKKVASAFELLFINMSKSKGLLSSLAGEISRDVRRIANSMDDVVQESEFIEDFLTKRLIETGGSPSQIGSIRPEDIKIVEKFTQEAKRAFNDLYGDPLKNQLELNKAINEYEQTVKRVGGFAGQNPLNPSFNAVTGTEDYIDAMKNLKSVQEQVARIEKKRIDQLREAQKAVDIEKKATKALREKIGLLQKEIQLGELKAESGTGDVLSDEVIESRANELAFQAQKLGNIDLEIQSLQIVASLERERAAQVESDFNFRLERNALLLEHDDKKIEKLREQLKIQREAAALRREEMDFSDELTEALISQASLQTAAVNSVMAAVSGLSHALADLAFGGTLDDFGKAMINTLKAIVAQLIKTVIVSMLLKAILGQPVPSGLALAPTGGTDPLTGLFDFVTPRATGFNGVVSQPTKLLVGESGPEEVMIKPRSRMNSGGSGSEKSVTVVINGDVYGEQKFMEAVRVANENLSRETINV